jgi:NAD(P)-dependent dehydrogenase (short-subunit alcohol dehydrogenase family)
MTILVTGSSRGIGLELTRQYIKSGENVIATARNPEDATQLNELLLNYRDALRVVRLDVDNKENCRNLASELHEGVLDLLINNAGIKRLSSLEQIDEQALNDSLLTNLVGPLRVIEAALPAMRRGEGKKIVNISTVMASIIQSAGDDAMPYRVSKAALNMATRIYARHLSCERFCVVAMHPGWIRTDMGGPAGPVNVEESAKAIVRVISRLTPEDTGRFIDALAPHRDIEW